MSGVCSLPVPLSVRSRRASGVIALFIALLGAAVLPLSAHAKDGTVCGPEVKEAVLSALTQLDGADPAQVQAAQNDLYKKYAYCADDAQLFAPADTFTVAARQCGARVSMLSSTYYEEMSCCGYDPQRRQFACPVKIKQPFGFGANPLPGSREYMLHCVQNPQGVFVPVGDDSVHLSDAPGLAPTWQFAVIAAAKEHLELVQPMNGAPRHARSILSWGLKPTGCDYKPIWGDAIDYDIRLDQ